MRTRDAILRQKKQNKKTENKKCSVAVLVVMIGISEYDSKLCQLNDLPQVLEEHKRMVDIMFEKWGYECFYATNKNKGVYSKFTDLGDQCHKNIHDLKLNWSYDEISTFLTQSKNTMQQDKHDRLIFFLSSHSDQSKMARFAVKRVFEVFLPSYSGNSGKI